MVYIKFTPIGETENVSFISVDRAICQSVLKVPVNDVEWGGGVLNWVDRFIFLFQMGVSEHYFTQYMKKMDLRVVDDSERPLMEVFQYIANNYEVSTLISPAGDVPLI